MRKIVLILALVGAALAAVGQALPSGSVLFGQNTWLAPDGSVWTGKDGYGYKKLLGPDDLLTKVDTSSAGYGLSWDKVNRQLNWGQIRAVQIGDQTMNVLEVDMDGIGADAWQLGRLDATGPNTGVAYIGGGLGAETPNIYIQAQGVNSGSLPSIFSGTDVWQGRDGVYITSQSGHGGSLFVGTSQNPSSDTANIIVRDLKGIGIVYEDDYESTFQDRSLVTKKYVDNLVAGGGADLSSYFHKDTSAVQFIYSPTTFDSGTQVWVQRTPTNDNDVANKKYVDDAVAGAGGDVAWNDITGKPSTFPPSAHTHAAADVVSGTFDAARIPNLNASKITAGTLNIARIPTGTTGSTVALGNHTHGAAAITSGTLNSARLPIATAGALGGVRVGTGLDINPATGVLSAQQPEGSLHLIDEITWTEFSTPNGPVHPLSVGYYVLTVSGAEEASSGVKQGTYTMVVYDRQVGGSAVGAGTVFLQHQAQAWCYNVYQDYGGNIRIEPLNSATTFRMFGGGILVDGPETILWAVPLTGGSRYGNIFTRDGDRVEIEYAGSFPSSEDKTLRLRIGPIASPDQVFSNTIPGAPATDWTLRVIVTRTDASTLAVEAYMQWGTSVEEMYQLQGTAEDTPFQTIQLTGQSNSGIILRNGRATYYPYLGPIDTAPL